MNRNVLHVGYAVSPWLSMSNRAPRQAMSCSLGSVIQTALVFGVEKVMEIVLTEENRMTQCRQARPNLP